MYCATVKQEVVQTCYIWFVVDTFTITFNVLFKRGSLIGLCEKIFTKILSEEFFILNYEIIILFVIISCTDCPVLQNIIQPIFSNQQG